MDKRQLSYPPPNNGCIRCPVCGELIPLTANSPETLRHVVFQNEDGLRIICPRRVERVMGWVLG